MAKFDANQFFALSPEERANVDAGKFGLQGESFIQNDLTNDLDFFDTVGDVFKAPVRGALGAAESILELGNLIPGIDYDIPDYFGVAGPSESFVGQITEGIFQFAIPFLAPGVGGAALAGKLGQGLKLANPTSKAILQLSKAGKVKTASGLRFGRRLSKDIFGGALTDFAAFDPSDGRLSDLLIQAPALTNPVTEFLASSENDSALEARFKNVLEGAGLGVMVDTLVAGLRFTRTASKAFSETKNADKAIQIAQEELQSLQLVDLQSSFKLSKGEASAVNGLISSMGLDRTRLTIGHTPYIGGFPQTVDDFVVLNQSKFKPNEAFGIDYGQILQDSTPSKGGSTTLLSDGSIPSSGYAVSVPGFKKNVKLTEFSEETLRSYAQTLGDLPSDAALGTQNLGNSIELAVNVVEQNLATALRMAKEFGEISVFDLSTGKAVEPLQSNAVLFIGDTSFKGNPQGISKLVGGKSLGESNKPFLNVFFPGETIPKEFTSGTKVAHVIQNNFTFARTFNNAAELSDLRKFLNENPQLITGEHLEDLLMASKHLGYDGVLSANGRAYLNRDILPEEIVKTTATNFRTNGSIQIPPTPAASPATRKVALETFNKKKVGKQTTIKKQTRGRDTYVLNQLDKREIPRGVTVFDDQGKAFIKGLNNPDVSTAIHEVFHVARRQILDASVPARFRAGITVQDINVLKSFAGTSLDSGALSVKAEEMLAEAFEAYIKDGIAPSREVARIFEKLSRYIRKVYRTVTGTSPDVAIPENVRTVFDKLTTRTVRAPGQLPERLLRQGSGGDSQLLFQQQGKPFSANPEDISATISGKPPEAFLNRLRLTDDEGAQLAADWLHQKLLAEGSIVDSTPFSHKELLTEVKNLLEDPNTGAIIEADGKSLVVDWDFLSSSQGEGALRDIHADLQMKRAANKALTDEMFAVAQAGKGASLEDAFAYAAMRANAVKISDAIEKTSAEAGRLLSSHRITPDIEIGANFIDTSLLEDQNAMRSFMSEIGSGDWERGLQKVRAEMEVFAAAPAHQRVKLMRRDPIGFFQMVQEYWMNSILSGPITATVNALSGAAMTIVKPLEKFIGHMAQGRWAKARQDLSRYVWMVQNVQDSLKFAARAFNEGNILDPGGRVLEGSIQSKAISRQGFSDVVQKATLGKVRPSEQSVMANMTEWLGNFINVPSKFLQSTDEFVKQINYRAEVKARLTDQAWQNGLTNPNEIKNFVDQAFDKTVEQGQIYSKAVARDRVLKKAAQIEFKSAAERQAWIRKEFAKEWDALSPELARISEESLGLAREVTFTTPLSGSRAPLVQVAGMWSKATEMVPLMRFLTPFVRTPTNLLAAAFNRNPVVGTSQFLLGQKAKLLGQMTAKDPEVAADAIGRYATGLGLTAMAFSAVQNNRMTGGGPRDPNQKKILESSGWQPYSIRAGDKWVSYQRMDPFSTIIGLWADIYEAFAHAPMTQDSEVMDLVNASLLSVSRNVTNKSYLNGLLQFFNAMSDERMGGTGEAVELATRTLFASFIPTASSQLSIIDDPTIREARNLTEAFTKRTYGLSDTLPPRRDLLGKPLMRKKAIGPDWLSPFAYSEIENDAIRQELAKVGHGFQAPNPERNGLDLREFISDTGQDAFDRWLELHGKVKIGNTTLETALSRLISSASYKRLQSSPTDALDDPRVNAIIKVLRRYRSRAFRQLLKEFPELDQQNTRIRLAQKALRSGRNADALLDLLKR